MVEIVAEISGNHGGSLKKMIEMITIAANRLDNDPRTACDYVKFQFYRPEDMPDRHEGDNEEMYRKLMVPDEWLDDLFKVAHELSIGLFASVFSLRAVETLLKFPCPYIKFASPGSTKLADKIYEEMVDACKGQRTVIWSVVNTDSRAPLGTEILLCPPGHPPAAADLWKYRQRFNPRYHLGYSDHTSGDNYWTALDFVNAGARMIEKHFKIDDKCVDAAFSADPHTMRLLCRLAHNR